MVSLGAIHKRHRGQISLSQPVVSSGIATGSESQTGTGTVTGTGSGSGTDTDAGSAVENNNDVRETFVTVENRTNAARSLVGRRIAPERENPAVRKFKDCVRDAERSSLILNLNMGRMPVVNKDTMSKRATLALTALAAKKENKKGTIPSSESVSAIDDVLSVVKNISFFGSGTKTYTNEKDEFSGAYCTAPVKYEFKDHETKFAAEKILKATSGINCSTPYPTLVRECIRQIVEDVKKDYPDNFIRVTLDTNNMVFKVARRPPKDAPDNGWKYGKVDIPVPDSALDINCRRVPKGFKIAIPEQSPKKGGRSDSTASSISSDEMEASGPNEV
jgi:predicted ribonuclease toxin of YeeF-YezG toxin-antitoxin module